ncbi:MAG: C40 family peptidase [Clostridia bacterium]|nr:C40 family peptidase [Clostridia bacterium]
MHINGSTVKRAIASLVLTTSMLTAIPAMAVEYIGIGKVTGNSVNVRTGASTDSQIIGRANSGVTFPALASENGWFQIAYNDKIAWICGAYFTVSPISIENSRGLVKGDVVNIREGASITSKVITSVPQGATLVVYGEEEGWYKVSANGHVGYISKDYFTTEAVATSLVSSSGQAVVDEALKHVGKAYVYGASGPNAFDCSGFTSYVFRQLGYTLNRVAADQINNGIAVDRANLQPGDIVLFNNRGTSYIGHVGIYIGNNKMVHASTSSTGVIITDLDSGYYAERYAGARRIVK